VIDGVIRLVEDLAEHGGRSEPRAISADRQ
jgi:hypothetical protein